MSDEIAKPMTQLDRNVLKAVQMVEQGHSWNYAADQLGMDRPGLRRAAAARGYHTIESHKDRRAYFLQQNAELLDQAGRNLRHQLDSGDLTGKDAATAYGILADKQARLEGWAGEAGSSDFVTNLGRTLLGGGAGEIQLNIKVDPAKVVDTESSDP